MFKDDDNMTCVHIGMSLSITIARDRCPITCTQKGLTAINFV